MPALNVLYLDVRLYLLEWRTIRELSQRQLGRIANVAYKTIGEIEINPEIERQPKTIGKLARALGIRPDDLKRPPDEVEQSPPPVREFRARTTGPVSNEEWERLNNELELVIRERELIEKERKLRERLRELGE